MLSPRHVATSGFDVTVAGVVKTTITIAAVAIIVTASYIPTVAKKIVKRATPAHVCLVPAVCDDTGTAQIKSGGFVIDAASAHWIKFQELYQEWQKERGARSSITETSMMPAYQSIIGMGQDAVPLILRQLRLEGDQPDQWFWALRSITTANPVDPRDQGNFPKMAEAWLRWGEETYAG
jgi:hypothetical protein